MADFPHTQIGELSLPRLIAGTNWFMGFSHQTQSRNLLIKELMTRERVADIMTAFAEEGVDAVYGGGPGPNNDFYWDGVKDAEQRTGRKITRICIPTLKQKDGSMEVDHAARVLDAYKECGCDLCMPHQNTTDAMIDRQTRQIVEMDRYLAMIRERGMATGLSTHTPEAPIYADETGLDVDTYIQIYNGAGFLMQIEIDWVHRQIWKRKKPVITIKPLAGGRLMPLVGLGFVWATLRECDCVTVGTLTTDEAKECVELSRAILEKRAPKIDLQRTRSKESVDGKA